MLRQLPGERNSFAKVTLPSFCQSTLHSKVVQNGGAETKFYGFLVGLSQELKGEGEKGGYISF